MKVYDSLRGKMVNAEDALFAERIIMLSKKQDMWSVIEEIVTYWQTTNPKQFKSFLIDVDEKKQTRAKSTGASSSSNMRYLVDIPIKLYAMIKAVYPDIIQEKDFFRNFAKRFPRYRVAERL